jgi:hypothetical protein
MTSYDIGFTGKLQEWENIQLDADNTEQAEEYAREHILDIYPEYSDVEIEYIKELTR